MATTITTAAAQVGEGRTPHYVRTDGFHAKTLCNRMVSREINDRDLAKLGDFCKPCVKALAAVETAATAETAPATDVDAPAAEAAESTPAPAPAATKRYRRTENGTTTYLTVAEGEAQIEELREAHAKGDIPELFAGSTGATYTNSDGLRIHLLLEDEETPAAAPAVHRFTSTEEAYDETQTRDDIRDGDVLVIESENVVGFLRSAWPGAITAEHGELHTFTRSARLIDNGKYVASVDLAEKTAQEIGADVDPTHAGPDTANAVPADAATFAEGDRVLCVDGLVRTATYTEIRDGRTWVFMADRSAWHVTSSQQIDTSRVDETVADAHRAAAALRARPDAPNPVDVARLGSALRYLRQADPARHAALIENADHIAVQVTRTEFAPGDIHDVMGLPHVIVDVCLAGLDSDAPRWWAKVLGTTKEARACSGRKPWETALRLDLAATSTETVQRPLPAAPDAPATADAPAVEETPAVETADDEGPVDPTRPEFAPFTSGTITEAARFYADVETRLAYPGHREDRITIHRAGHADAVHYIALPHVAGRSAATVLGAVGWEIVDGLEYLAGINTERGQVRHTEPTTTPEALEIRDAVLSRAIGRAVALRDHSGARIFRDVMPEDGSPYPIGWTYRTTGYGDSAQYGWVTAKGRGTDRVGVATPEEAEAIVRDWHATGMDAPTHTALVDVLTDLPGNELGAVSATLRNATERQDGPVRTAMEAQDAVAAAFPTADKFEQVITEDGLLGYTFQVGKLHGARYGWVTRYGTYGKSLERRRSAARDMLPAQVADAQRANGVDAPTPTATYEPTPAPEGTTCVHGLTEQEGDETGPAAVCAAKEPAGSVGVFSDEGCVTTRDCAVQAAEIVHQLNMDDDEAPTYRWAVLCPEHEEQPAIGCEECATAEDGDEDGDQGDAPEADTAVPAPFAAGDRVVCADGVARTVTGMAPAVTGEPARVVVEDGTEWVAANCLPANPADVSAALADSSVAASVVATADSDSPEWQEALAELGRLLAYLKAADPVTRAAMAQSAAQDAARAVHAEANNFTGIYLLDSPAPVAWSFRVGNGDTARYGVVTVDCKVSPIGLYEYRVTAERAFQYGEMPASR
ncbi:hypothetical protein [Streptomyces anulatus]|uniref:hypothetical protein n=1 Tax=Streptomyces anulatus TaxID=1892 RepID=UPI00343FD1B7